MRPGLTSLRALPALLLAFLAFDAVAQGLEPRRWTHLPTGIQIVGSAVAATEGDIIFDPVLRIEDATFELYTTVGSYLRTFEWLGRSNRIDLQLPYAYGRWEGLVDGAYRSIRRHGFGDPSVRWSMHLLGAPPLSGRELAAYRAENPVTTSLSVGLAVTLPLGEYYRDRLINLGGNRFVLRPQLGVLHRRGPWEFEATGSVGFFEDNDEFFGGTRLEQDPLGFIQGHVIRGFGQGFWGGVSGGYSYGGESTIDGVAKNNDERTRFTALSVGGRLGQRATFKLAWVNAETNVLLGSNSDTLLLTASVALGGG